jgi:hypothetical protein
MKQCLVVVTWAGNDQTLPSFLKSIENYHKYPLVIVVNEYLLMEPSQLEDLARNNIILANRENLWECGAIYSVLQNTDYDEFIFLQDTQVIKDPTIFDLMFSFKDQSVIFGYRWGCYLAKYRREILSQIVKFPITRTKMDSMYWEVMLPRQYSMLERKIPELFYYWRDDNPKNWVEEKFGRSNLVLDNPYILKYKGTVAFGDFKTTDLTWDELKDNWNKNGEYFVPV